MRNEVGIKENHGVFSSLKYAEVFIRKIRSYYFRKRIRPFIRFTSAVEIDETKVGA